MSNTKTRKEIIDECVTAVAACFNYYSDAPLGDGTRFKIRRVLDATLPNQIVTTKWQEYADDYDYRVRMSTEAEGEGE